MTLCASTWAFDHYRGTRHRSLAQLKLFSVLLSQRNASDYFVDLVARAFHTLAMLSNGGPLAHTRKVGSTHVEALRPSLALRLSECDCPFMGGAAQGEVVGGTESAESLHWQCRAGGRVSLCMCVSVSV